ncbi:hypothetical protein [Armatimonas sp.]|uniref:hypothetical protein n=1 Tax=Armatimonas sp. TaxID=1872638 RepID=UPI00375202EE
MKLFQQQNTDNKNIITEPVIPIPPNRFLPPLTPNFKADIITRSDESIPENIKDLIRPHDIIITCYVEGILRFSHSPFNSPHMFQNTLYSVHVEKYLKGTGTQQIKVLQSGGPLAWQSQTDSNKIKTGYKIYGNPFLLVNTRYILFLRDPSIYNTQISEKGYAEHTVKNIKGISFYAEEYLFINPLHGKILLKNGYSYSSLIVDIPNSSWKFPDNPQIVGIPEIQAIKNIENAIFEINRDEKKALIEANKQLRSKGIIR